jgi:hypothetical protein
MKPKEFFTRHIRGWFPEDYRMPENMIYASMGRYYMSTRLSDFVRFLSNISIGIGLAYASMMSVMALSLFFPVTNDTGTIASLVSFIAVGFAYLHFYRKSFNVDTLTVLKICLAIFFIAPFSFYSIPLFEFTDFGLLPVIFSASAFLAIGIVGIHRNKTFLKICSGIFFIALFTFIVGIRIMSIPLSLLSSFLTISSFLIAGLVGIYGYKKYRKIGFCCMALSLLFLVWVPIVNVWQIRSGYGGGRFPFVYSALHSVYTVPLILASFAFFVLGITLIIYKKSQTINVQNLGDTPIAEQETFKQDTTGNIQEETTAAGKTNINFKSLGFSLILFSQLSIIWAAIFYVYQGFRSWELYIDAFSALPFLTIGVALFALGVASLLYKKPKKLGFLVVASGSAALITAAFAYTYDTQTSYSSDGWGLLFDSVTPYREFTQPLLLASIALFAVGYILMLKKSQKTAPTTLP